MSVPKVGNSISSVGQLAGRAARLASRMTFDFEELDYRPTPIGALSLRRRRELKLGVDVFEIKLGDEFLMSSLFTASEIALARLGLAELSEHGLDAVVTTVRPTIWDYRHHTNLVRIASSLRADMIFGKDRSV